MLPPLPAPKSSSPPLVMSGVSASAAAHRFMVGSLSGPVDCRPLNREAAATENPPGVLPPTDRPLVEVVDAAADDDEDDEEEEAALDP